MFEATDIVLPRNERSLLPPHEGLRFMLLESSHMWSVETQKMAVGVRKRLSFSLFLPLFISLSLPLLLVLNLLEEFNKRQVIVDVWNEALHQVSAFDFPCCLRYKAMKAGYVSSYGNKIELGILYTFRCLKTRTHTITQVYFADILSTIC